MVGVIATPGKSLQLRMRCKTAFILIDTVQNFV